MVNINQYNKRIIKIYEIINNTNSFADLKTENIILLNSFIFSFVNDSNLIKELYASKICLDDLYYLVYDVFKEESIDFKHSPNLFSIFRSKFKDKLDNCEEIKQTFLVLTNIESKPIEELSSYNALLSIFDVSLEYPQNELLVLKTTVVGKSCNYARKKALNNIYSALGFFNYLSASGTKYTFSSYDIKIDYSFCNYELFTFINSKESLITKTNFYKKRRTTTLLKDTQNRIFNHYLLLKIKKFLFIYKTDITKTEFIIEIFKDYFIALSEKNLEFSYIKLWLTIEKIIKEKYEKEKFSNFDEMIKKLLPMLNDIIRNRSKLNNFYKNRFI